MPSSQLAKRILPTPDTLLKTPGLGWLGRYLDGRPWLWVAHRRRVAMGAALGVGFGVLPLPSQMVMAGTAAVLCRANVGAAVAATWLTNPLTLVPIWSLAIALGNLVLPGAPQEATVSMLELQWTQPLTWLPALWDWLLSLGKPLVVGLPLAGVVLGSLTYAVVYYAWWGIVVAARRRRVWLRRKAS